MLLHLQRIRSCGGMCYCFNIVTVSCAFSVTVLSRLLFLVCVFFFRQMMQNDFIFV